MNWFRRLFGLCKKSSWLQLFHNWEISNEGPQRSRTCKMCGDFHIWKEASMPFEPHGWYEL